MYEKGEGASKSNKQAEQWYHKAAEQGFAWAQYKLGLLYAIGTVGVKRNYVVAYKWLDLASSKGITQADKALIVFVK